MNVQNIPRSQKDVKRAFQPKHDAFLFFDYKAIEVRMLAYYLAIGIGDSSLRDEINAGLDPHHETAKGLFNKDNITDEERQVGKTLNFSIIYGGGTPTIMRQLGVGYPEAKRLLKAYHATRPGISLLRDSIDRTLAHRGYIINSHGRHLHVEDSHKALNALIQGSAADIMREAVVKVHAYLADKDSHIVNIIHDEIMIDATLYETSMIVYHVPELMKPDKINDIMPIEVDCEWSQTNWAEKEEYAWQLTTQ
jgi:DNA polymerase-1